MLTPSSTSTALLCASSPPRPLSLDRILRLHNREELLVPPFQWTSRHLELLQCSFDPPSPSTPRQWRFKAPFTDRRAATIAYRWASTFGLGFRIGFIRDLLADPDGPLRSTTSVASFVSVWCALGADMRCCMGCARDGFDFYYRQSSTGRLPCIGFFLRSASEQEPQPVAAWTEARLIDSVRYKALGVAHTRPVSNAPVHRLTLLRLEAITPPDRLHDPYIVALLIAVAQGQRKTLSPEQRSDRRTFRVRFRTPG